MSSLRCVNSRVDGPGAGARGYDGVHAMATFFRRSQVWVVDYTWHGRPRQWFKALPQGTDARAAMLALLRELHGDAARLVDVRPATAQEEERYVRGDLPRNVLCPTGRAPRTAPKDRG